MNDARAPGGRTAKQVIMFTGIVTEIGEVAAVRQRGEELLRLKILCGFDRATIVEGVSIACSGICLTVVGAGEEEGRTWFAVDAAAETLRVTNAGTWRHGTRVNLERALKMGDELGGHLVAGHIDGLAEVIAREDLTDMARLALRAPPGVVRFIAAKGSVALDGVSLTVNEVDSDMFSVLIIPHTLQVTTLGTVRTGDKINLEVDLMARYAARLLDTQA
jgi:riboflavin synthase